MRKILSVFNPLPVQRAFLLSEAKIRGYGGAMGGGKSRTGCEAVFDAALDNPGLVALIARQAHTSIVETTRKTMLGQVIPADDALITRKIESGGKDFIRLFNGSVIHFIGLDDPIRWYSSEIGMIFFDEAQEIEEDTVLRLITRLRQPGMPCKAILTFNPSNPGHWLQRWFMLDDERASELPVRRTQFGFHKPQLWMEGATEPLGDAEFFFAKASDNIYLPAGYVENTLGGMKEWMRRRYLEGMWEFISGASFFDQDSLRFYMDRANEVEPLFTGTTVGDVAADVAYRTGRATTKPDKDKIRVEKGPGPLTVWKTPVRESEDANGVLHHAHRYVLAVDASSGRARDWSAIEVIDIDTFEQVAEMRLNQETGLVAEQAYRLGRIYNDGLIAPEVTGGWGLAIDQVLKRFHYPRIYTRRTFDRLSSKYTDRTGWDTTVRTRMVILETLETVLREREFRLYSLQALNEMGTFVYSEREKAEAQPGCNDDLVMALAIGVTITQSQPRQLKRVVEREHVPQFATTGY